MSLMYFKCWDLFNQSKDDVVKEALVYFCAWMDDVQLTVFFYFPFGASEMVVEMRA